MTTKETKIYKQNTTITILNNLNIMKDSVVKRTSCSHCHRDDESTSAAATPQISEFVAAVKNAVSLLTGRCGYSHERATSALLRELSRGDMPPSEVEIFNTMNNRGLGLGEAAQALAISRALKRGMSDNGLSLQEAIDGLTSKLSLSNLVKSKYEFEDECLSPDPSSSSRAPSSVSITPKIHAIAAPSVQRPNLSTPISRKVKPTSKSAKAKLKNSTNVRRRSIDEIGQVEKRDSTTFQTRDRADSLSTTEVNAKIAKKSLRNDEGASLETPLRPAPTVRSKRGRVDDSENNPSALKRARTNEA